MLLTAASFIVGEVRMPTVISSGCITTMIAGHMTRKFLQTNSKPSAKLVPTPINVNCILHPESMYL